MRAFRYFFLKYLNNGKIFTNFKNFKYVNNHFSEGNNMRGSTYSIIEYVNLKEYNDDDDGGTVIDIRLIIF